MQLVAAQHGPGLSRTKDDCQCYARVVSQLAGSSQRRSADRNPGDGSGWFGSPDCVRERVESHACACRGAAKRDCRATRTRSEPLAIDQAPADGKPAARRAGWPRWVIARALFASDLVVRDS